MLNVPLSIGFISSLEALDLSGNTFSEIPASIIQLSNLQYLGLRDCLQLRLIPALPPCLTKLDADNCISLRSVTIESTRVGGNIFEFFFTNCDMLDNLEKQCIMAYALTKIHCYSELLYNQVPSVVAGESSLCFPGFGIPEWFCHQNVGFSTTLQLPSNWANTGFLGFTLCAVITFNNPHIHNSGLQVKCRYHLKNRYGDCNDLHSYFGGLYGTRYFGNCDTFFGYDPCLDVKKDDKFGKYNEVLIEFYPEDMNGDPLPCSDVRNCGVRLLYAQEESFYRCPTITVIRNRIGAFCNRGVFSLLGLLCCCVFFLLGLLFCSVLSLWALLCFLYLVQVVVACLLRAL